MKGRYNKTDKILDAGCGTGRNLRWFLQNGIDISGIDMSADAINNLKKEQPDLPAGNLLVASVEHTPFAENQFDHIIISAVLHFAESTEQFNKMITEMVRILRPGGSLFIRMTSDIGIEEKVKLIADGVYLIPDGSKRFLLTKVLLAECMLKNNLSFIEPLKTVNVNDIRCMSTLVLQKN